MRIQNNTFNQKAYYQVTNSSKNVKEKHLQAFGTKFELSSDILKDAAAEKYLNIVIDCGCKTVEEAKRIYNFCVEAIKTHNANSSNHLTESSTQIINNRCCLDENFKETLVTLQEMCNGRAVGKSFDELGLSA